MRNAASIFLFILMVSIQTPVAQLFKFPLLIEHFKKHQTNNGDSFITFLEGHYAMNHTDADLPEDQQLPFKNVTYYSIAFAIVPSVIQADVLTPLPVERKIVFSEIYTPQQHLTCIFHPPRG